MARTLIVSDIHLCGVVPSTAGAWLAYRQPAALLDADLAALILQSGANEIVFNGDVFDFDAPDVRTHSTVRDRSERAAVSLIAAILDDHPLVVDAIRRSPARKIFIPGNHDAQLAYTSVQNVIRSRLGPVTFAPNFYTTADGFHVEHGHMYDPLCSHDGPADDSIGTIVTFYTPLIFGCASPYAGDPLDTDWIAGLCGCASTELAMACLRDLLLLVSARPRVVTFGQRDALYAPKTLASGLIEGRAWKNYGDEAQRRLYDAQVKIAEIYSAPGVVMGHTHAPFGFSVGDTWYGNSGSWVGDVGTYVWIENGVATQRVWR